MVVLLSFLVQLGLTLTYLQEYRIAIAYPLPIIITKNSVHLFKKILVNRQTFLYFITYFEIKLDVVVADCHSQHIFQLPTDYMKYYSIVW